jgi:hypothetical protein
MRRYKPPPAIRRNDKRCGDAYIRQWAKALGSVREAERQAGVYRGNLHNWLVEPDRRFSPATTLKIAQASNCPTEALEYRWIPIRDLHMWKFLEAVK